MATTKRSKGGRASANRAKTTARGRATKSAKPTPKKKTAAPVAPHKAKTAKAKPTRTTKPARGVAKPARSAAVESAEVRALKSKFQRERNGLEKRLTEAVREIGLLRHHELRAIHFERQVAERDATIERLRTQLSELERRPSEPVYVHEIQQSLALGAPPHQHGAVGASATTDIHAVRADLDHSAVDLDEFEDDRLSDDGDLVSDDD